MNLKREIRREVRWSIAMSVVMIMIGVLAIIVPHIAGIAATIFFGSLLVVAGVAHLVFAWDLRRDGGFWWGALIGIICAATGGYILLHPSVGLSSLTIVLSAWLFMEAILEFVLASYLRSLQGSGWLVFDGIIMVMLGFLICWTWPGNANWVIGTFVGISLLCSGIARLMLSLTARRLANEFRVEVRERANVF